MSEFHRMVTYLYLYEGSQKIRNAGYAKIEKKDAHCRVEIHMKNTGLMEHDIPVYFYAKNDVGFPGILLGSIHFSRGIGDFKELLNSSSLADTGCDISNVKGIFLPISEREMILSQWDDDAFDRSSFFPTDSFTFTETPPAQDSSASKKSASSANSFIPEEPSVSLKTSESEDGLLSEKGPTLPEDAAAKTKTDSCEETMHVKAAEAAVDLSQETPNTTHSHTADTQIWDFIMNNFPAVSPFPTEDTFEWVQLELKDLRLLPKSYWYLGNNSFLLHGFFNYHHLLLGRKKDTKPREWALGIPGVFQNPERVMATFFGFPEFHSTSEANTKTGQFGYWLRPL